MTELERIMYKYLQEENTVTTYSDIEQEEINKLFQNMMEYERPDILSIYDNKIIGIEHFEFDSYKNNRKGSDYKFQDNNIQKRMNETIKTELKNTKEVYIHDEIKNTGNLNQYYENFKKVLISHLDNIEEYKQHIANDYGNEKKIEIWFFVEDVTPLGNHCLRKGTNCISLLIPLSSEIINILKSYKEIKGIIFGIFNMKEYKLVMINNDEKTLNKIENDDCFKVNDEEFLSFNPQEIGFALSIPKEDLKVNNNE